MNEYEYQCLPEGPTPAAQLRGHGVHTPTLFLRKHPFSRAKTKLPFGNEII